MQRSQKLAWPGDMMESTLVSLHRLLWVTLVTIPLKTKLQTCKVKD